MRWTRAALFKGLASIRPRIRYLQLGVQEQPAQISQDSILRYGRSECIWNLVGKAYLCCASLCNSTGIELRSVFLCVSGWGRGLGRRTYGSQLYLCMLFSQSRLCCAAQDVLMRVPSEAVEAVYGHHLSRHSPVEKLRREIR